MRERRERAVHRAQVVHPHEAFVEAPVGDLVGTRPHRLPRTAEQRIDAPEPGHGPVDEQPALRLVRDVAGHQFHLDALPAAGVGHHLQARRVARGEHEARAASGEGARHFGSDAERGAGEYDYLPAPGTHAPSPGWSTAAIACTSIW